MALDGTIHPNDNVTEVDGIKVVVDGFTAMYLGGAVELDYEESRWGGGFRLHGAPSGSC